MKSMTGFGRSEAADENYSVCVETSSVNRKQLEIAFSMPRIFSSIEPELRKVVQDKVSRGRVSVLCTIQRTSQSTEGLRVDREKVLQLEREFKSLSEVIGRPMELTPQDIINVPDVIREEEIQPAAISELLRQSLEKSLHHMIEMREMEGADLLQDCKERLSNAGELLLRISQRAPHVLENYRESLMVKLEALKTAGESWRDDDRIVKEIALFADRSDISEEVTRFRSHLDKFHDYLAMDQPIGRSLDFLCQELNRELNTIGAKANDALLAHLVVEGKTEIEKIREQIQNVE